MDNPLLREPLGESTSSRGCSGTGAPRPGEFHLRPSQPPHRRARSEHDLRRRAGSWRARAWSRTPISRAPTASSIRTSAERGGMQRLFTQFSFPGGIPSHVAPETPVRSMRAANSAIRCCTPMARCSTTPDLIACCVVGDGEAETGPLAASWHSNKFLNPARDGAVLPILHLNGYKIAGPTVLARIPETSCTASRRLWLPALLRRRRRSGVMHQQMAGTLDAVFAEIRSIQDDARSSGFANGRPGR